MVPTGTSKEIVALLNREITKILALPDMKERLVTLGCDAVASPPEEFARFGEEVDPEWTCQNCDACDGAENVALMARGA